ncbi:MAG: preprotein translocase subunit SecE [Firmicutes bacterium]|nr:preprotein translocase subunit SecE [Bacillota bacterium]
MATESGAESKKEKKPNIAVRIGRWFKLAALELRKATWPKGREVFKKLGTVLIVVLFFFIILLVIDYALGWGYTGLTRNIIDDTQQALANFNLPST